MFHRDYFLRMIEEAGTVIAKLLGLRRENRYQEARKLFEEGFASFFNFPREQFRYLRAKELLHFLIVEEKLANEQLTVMADLLGEEGEILFGESKWKEGQYCLLQALDILQYLNEAEKGLYSIERVDKISMLEDRLDELKP